MSYTIRKENAITRIINFAYSYEPRTLSERYWERLSSGQTLDLWDKWYCITRHLLDNIICYLPIKATCFLLGNYNDLCQKIYINRANKLTRSSK